MMHSGHADAGRTDGENASEYILSHVACHGAAPPAGLVVDQYPFCQFVYFRKSHEAMFIENRNQKSDKFIKLGSTPLIASL